MARLTQDEIEEILTDCANTNDDSDEIECRLLVAAAFKTMSERSKTSTQRSNDIVMQQLREEMLRLRPQACRLLYGEK